jgi:hypothetical protein
MKPEAELSASSVSSHQPWAIKKGCAQGAQIKNKYLSERKSIKILFIYGLIVLSSFTCTFSVISHVLSLLWIR